MRIVAAYKENGTEAAVYERLGMAPPLNREEAAEAKAAYDALPKAKKAALAVIAAGGSVK